VLLAKLTTLLETASTETEVRARLEALVPWVRGFVERGMAKTSRSPEDFVPYQRLLWKYSSNSVDNNNNSDTQVDNKAAAREELVELVQEMKYRYHARLWHNTFNDMSFLSPPPPPNTAGVERQTAVAEVGKDSMGPPRLFQSIQSAFVLHLFADWRYPIPPFLVPNLFILCLVFRFVR
jgi:hypothetical protein